MMAKSFQRLVLCGMACLCTGGAHGIEPEDLLHYKIGNWHFRPHASTSLTANDNIFFRDSSAESETLFGPKEGDVITQLGTGFQAALGRNDINTFGFGYDYLYRDYLKHAYISSGDHSFKLSSQLSRGRFGLRVSNNTNFNTGIQGGESAITAQNDRLATKSVVEISYC